MKNNWQTKTLGEVSEVSYGYTESASIKKVGPKFLRITDLQNGSVAWDDVPYCLCSKDDLKKYRLKTGDIVFARTGATTGKSYQVINPPEAVCASYLIRLRILENAQLDPSFLHYYFQTDWYWETIRKESVGSAQGGFNATKLQALQFQSPTSLPEQRRIVAILDDVFERTAKAKANAEKNLANAKEVFESYLQGIDAPKSELGAVVDIKTGKLDSNAARENGKYPFFTCSRETFAIDNFAFDCDAILLAGNNAVGDFNVKHYNGKFNAYQRTYVITVNDLTKADTRFLYYQLLTSLKGLKEQSVGAGTKFLKLGMIKNFRIALPSLAEQRTIVSNLDALSSETKQLEAIYRQKLS